MRFAFFIGAVVFVSAMQAVNAADLPVLRHKEAVIQLKAPAANVSCLRWIEQTYSWYNYCDPIPHYDRGKYSWWD
jgi:hypothetical protein